MTLVPLDDTVDLNADCNCEFTPYPPPDMEESTHYLRRCPICKTTFYSTHCPHEGDRFCSQKCQDEYFQAWFENEMNEPL